MHRERSRGRPRHAPAPARWAALALLLAVGAGGSGCFPPEADFKFGIGTSEIVGAVEAPGDPKPDFQDVLIVVFQTHYLFQTLDSERRVYRVSADLRSVDPHGEFRVPMPSDVVSLELIVIAPDRLSRQFKFNRQVGIGQVSYNPELPLHNDWYSHYYTYIQPMLSHLIVEQRYRLSNEDQQRLGDWLHTQSERLQAQRPSPAATPPGEG